MRPNFFFESPNLKERRQELRNKATDVEQILWQKLRRNQTGVKFRRQYSIGGYIVDFYCPSKRLAIELDGKQHLLKDSKEYDLHRTKYIGGVNITVVRFMNKEVFSNINEVLNKISSLLG